MIPLCILLPALLVIFSAAFTKSAFGFGDALVNMPLLTLLIGLESSAPLVSMLSFIASLIILLFDRHNLEWKGVGKLLLGAAIGIPFGLAIVHYSDAFIMKKVLGSLVIAFSVYNLAKPELGYLRSERWGYLFGGIAGILSGAYNISGPPVVIYANLRAWPPAKFRVTLQAFFMPVAMMTMSSHALAFHYTWTILTIALIAVPVLFLAIFVGKMVNNRIKNPDKFRRIIYGLLILLGAALFL